jgi:hypothetical protein
LRKGKFQENELENMEGGKNKDAREEETNKDKSLGNQYSIKISLTNMGQKGSIR